MKTLYCIRHLVAVRCRQGSPSSYIDIQLKARLTAGGVEVQFDSPQVKSNGLEAVTQSARKTLLQLLPLSKRHDLLVEAGSVSLETFQEGGNVEHCQRHYILATCSGVVLACNDNLINELSSPWVRSIEKHEIHSEMPVILGPSAVLTLVSYVLEVAATEENAAMWPSIPFLSVVDTTKSPYPPQDHPYTFYGGGVSERTLIAAGIFWDANEMNHEGDDPLFSLFTRTERWLRPLGALHHTDRRNLEIYFDLLAQAPIRSLVIDSLTAYDSVLRGAVGWEAEYSLLDPDFGAGCGHTPLRFCCDPWSILARARGATGPLCLALDRDPIGGNWYGLAPSLVTDLTVEELLKKGHSNDS